jgi:pimeloyl-ACP methyl ester carboxylesterase
MKVKSSDGCEIYYDRMGSGPPIVLLHGFSQFGELWSRHGWTKTLSTNNSVIVIDLRGCGLSDAPDAVEQYSLEQHLQDIDAVLIDCGVQQCVVWGWSFGGTLALQLAKYRNYLKFALVAGTYFGKIFSERYVDARLEQTTDKIDRLRWQALSSWSIVNPSELACPATVYSGSNDGNVVVQLRRQLKSINRAGVELKIFDQLDHGGLVSRVDVVRDFVLEKLAC